MAPSCTHRRPDRPVGSGTRRTAVPQTRTGVELVQIDVTVLDNQRRPLTGLAASDFTVLDDGVETPIRAFTPVELARTLATGPVWAGDVSPVTNQAAKENGRLVVILLDRSIPLQQPTVTARNTAIAAVRSLGPNDLRGALLFPAARI